MFVFQICLSGQGSLFITPSIPGISRMTILLQLGLLGERGASGSVAVSCG